LAAIARALGGKVNGQEAICRCPAHDDKTPSLWVTQKPDGKLLVKCHAGCSQSGVVAALKARGLWPEHRPNGKAKEVRRMTFDYRDPATGEVRHRKERIEFADGSKTFFIKPKGRNGSEPLLYGAERLADLAEGQPVWIVEGEKCVDRLRQLGAIAVSGDVGADSKWLPSHAELLRGLPIILWPDSDEAGEGYIAAAAQCINGHAASLRIVRPFGLPNGSKGRDVCDWQGDLAKLAESAESYAPNGREDPLPLFPPLPSPAPYPIDALGPVLSLAAAAIARKAQVPAAMAAQSVLAAAALAASAHANVVLPYGQPRPLSLFFLTAAASGDRKSTADTEALWPIRKHERALKEQHADAMKTWRINHAAWTAEKRKIEGSKIEFSVRRERLSVLGPEPERPLDFALVSGDPTLEGLIKAWPCLHPSHGIFTAEGGMFSAGHAMNDDNRLRSAAMLSELWDGKPVTRIRALDGVSSLHGRRLSMHLMIQPDAAGIFILNPVLRNQGLLSRILLANVSTLAGSRLYRDADASDETAIKAYGGRILTILEADPPLEPGTRNELAPRELSISQEAKADWVRFYNHVESQCGQYGELADTRDFAAKAAEHAARIAGVLTVVESLLDKEIGPKAMANAIRLAGWYVGEACRLLQAGCTDARLVRAKTLLDWLESRPDRKAGFREMLQFGPSATRTKAVADEAIKILLDHRLVAELSQRPRVIRAIEAEP
jgi:hypothetical protein